MLEYVLLGALQGIFEWLPVSSEGILLLVSGFLSVSNPLEFAFWLHLGTVLSVLVYFHEKIPTLLKSKETMEFLLVTTCVSLSVGLILYELLTVVPLGSSYWYLLVGVGLIITSFVIQNKKSRFRTIGGITSFDAVVVGCLQGLAVVPGISRSGITMFALLNQGFSPETALNLSFLLSVPVVVAANVFIVVKGISFGGGGLLALMSSCVVGLVFIRILQRVVGEMDVSVFVRWFGILSIISYFL